MPELPEVETTIRDLKKKVLRRTFIDVWLNAPKLIKRPTNFLEFKESIRGKKIQSIRRRGKNIILGLSGGSSLLIHQKMTGHLLYGKWKQAGGQWQAQGVGPLKNDPMNRHLHLIFWLDNGYQIALSDVRKFAKVELWQAESLKKSSAIKNLGPDALARTLTFEKFKERFKRRRGKIKQVLMNQAVIAGIGNIYADEILFWAKVHPAKPTNKLSAAEFERIYQEMREILRKAIEVKGTSVSDYRAPGGEKGKFGALLEVYRKAGKQCSRCGTNIERTKIGSRSAHFCPKCQQK